MCGDCLLSVISGATELGEEDWSCSFLAITVPIVFGRSICTNKPMIASDVPVRAREI